jgi:hypothetical protein
MFASNEVGNRFTNKFLNKLFAFVTVTDNDKVNVDSYAPNSDVDRYLSCRVHAAP